MSLYDEIWGTWLRNNYNGRFCADDPAGRVELDEFKLFVGLGILGEKRIEALEPEDRLLGLLRDAKTRGREIRKKIAGCAVTPQYSVQRRPWSIGEETAPDIVRLSSEWVALPTGWPCCFTLEEIFFELINLKPVLDPRRLSKQEEENIRRLFSKYGPSLILSANSKTEDAFRAFTEQHREMVALYEQARDRRRTLKPGADPRPDDPLVRRLEELAVRLGGHHAGGARSAWMDRCWRILRDYAEDPSLIQPCAYPGCGALFLRESSGGACLHHR